MKRRDLIKLAPVALAVGAAPVAASVGETDTPVMRAYRLWRAADEDLKDPKWDARNSDEQNAACARFSEMQDAILEIPAENSRDFILKVMAYTYLGEHGLPDHIQRPDFWAEANALAGGVA